MAESVPEPAARDKSFLGRLIAPGGYVICIALSFNLARLLSERIVLTYSYGAARYAAGLRFAAHHRLSDGTLPFGDIEMASGLITWVFVIIVILLYALTVHRLRAVKRRRASGPPPLPRPESSLAEEPFRPRDAPD